jgi:hypothetical protein
MATLKTHGGREDVAFVLELLKIRFLIIRNYTQYAIVTGIFVATGKNFATGWNKGCKKYKLKLSEVPSPYSPPSRDLFSLV